MNLSDNKELDNQVEYLLTNWGWWSTQGTGTIIPRRTTNTQPAFKGSIKHGSSRAVNEDDAMAADSVIGKMGHGTISREILFAIYYSRLDSGTIENILKIDKTEQDRRLGNARQYFWDLWERTFR